MPLHSLFLQAPTLLRALVGTQGRSPVEAQLRFAKRSYISRSGGLLAALLMFGAVMVEKDATLWQWVPALLFCLIWPSLAYWGAIHAPSPRDAERLNLLTDHVAIGFCMPIMQFNLLPCLLALAMPAMNTLAGGGLALLWRGWLAQVAGLLAGAGVFGWVWAPASSLAVIWWSVPLLLFQPMAVGYVAFHAIRSLNTKRAELERLSQTDGLSGLHNRLHWERLLRAEFARYQRTGSPSTLVVCDLDHFKRINDTYGHAAGDEAIRRLANTFRRVLRATDVAGRIGGEEFAVLLPNTGAISARDVVERLQADMQFHPLLEAEAVTASFGVVEIDRSITTVEMWMRLADEMMYEAKHAGRNRLVERPPSAPMPLREDVL